MYGSQSVVVCFDVAKKFFGGIKLVSHSGTKNVKLNLNEGVELFESKGAGEFIIQDILNEGTFKGYNLELLNAIGAASSVPIVISGGCNSVEDMKEALVAGANAVAASSYFVYRNNNTESILIHYPPYQLIKEKLSL